MRSFLEKRKIKKPFKTIVFETSKRGSRTLTKVLEGEVGRLSKGSLELSIEDSGVLICFGVPFNFFS